jgi:hypothetical protein
MSNLKKLTMSNITEILHSIPVDEQTGSISVPVYQTTTFIQQAPGVNKGFDYSRTANPTRKALENIIAKMEGGYASYAFATGLAAIDSVVKLLSNGDEIIAVDDIYGGAYRLFTHVYKKLGIKIHYVDTTEVKNITKYVNENTKLIWLETPTNPTLKITDIEETAKIAKSVNALLVVDKVSFLYEAAVCGSVPIIRNLEEYFDNDLLKSIKGIVNGSTNFILSKMTTDNAPYDKVLKIAQENGFAESNPTLDVEGIYAKYKLSIITLHALGKRVKPEDIVCQGITSLHPFDFQYANEKNRVIKLIARCNPSENGEIISLSVFPIFLKKDSPLASTHNEYNGVIVEILASIPTYDCEAKFFISYQGNKFQLLQSLFENNEEKFESKGRNYVIGNIKLKKLNDCQLLNHRNYSIIQID